MGKTFWSVRKLRELRSKARKMDLPQLARHFKKTEDSVHYALEYAESLRKMRMGKVKKEVHGKVRQVLLIKPGYARFSISLTSLFD